MNCIQRTLIMTLLLLLFPLLSFARDFDVRGFNDDWNKAGDNARHRLNEWNDRWNKGWNDMHDRWNDGMGDARDRWQDGWDNMRDRWQDNWGDFGKWKGGRHRKHH